MPLLFLVISLLVSVLGRGITRYMQWKYSESYAVVRTAGVKIGSEVASGVVGLDYVLKGGGTMEFLLECLLTFWMELAMKALPQPSGRKARLFAKLAVVGLLLYVVMAFTAGSIMLSEGIGSRGAAIVLLVSAVGIVLFQIVSGSIYYQKKK